MPIETRLLASCSHATKETIFAGKNQHIKAITRFIVFNFVLRSQAILIEMKIESSASNAL